MNVPRRRPLHAVVAVSAVVLGVGGAPQAAEVEASDLPGAPPAAAPHPAPGGDPLGALVEQRGLTMRGGAALPEAAAADVVLAALNFLDTPYRLGGSALDGFDCSGFTRHVYATARGWTLPRRAEEQAQAPGWQAVPVDALQPGDLVFFNTLQRAHSHVGIYVGDGRFVHAPRSGAQVRVERLQSPYWQSRFDGARRAGDMASQRPGDAG